MRDLFKELCADRLNAEELEIVISSFFGRGRRVSGDEVHYGFHENDSAVKLIFSPKDKLLKILKGDALNNECLLKLKAEIHRSLLMESERKVGRQVIFSDMPVNSAYRYKDWFQISPVPLESSSYEKGLVSNPHPLVLEVSFIDSPNLTIQRIRRDKALREVRLICTPFLQARLFCDLQTKSKVWVVDDKKATSSLMSVGYTWPGNKWISNDFTVVESFKKMPQIDSSEYYSRHGLMFGSSFDAPLMFDESLVWVESLKPKDSLIFLTACYWLSHSFDVKNISYSAAFVALVSALEALIIKPNTQEKFKKFIGKYVSHEPILKDKFYEIRSRISHGDLLLYSDTSSGQSFYRGMNDHALYYNLADLTKKAIRNWVHSR